MGLAVKQALLKISEPALYNMLLRSRTTGKDALTTRGQAKWLPMFFNMGREEMSV